MKFLAYISLSYKSTYCLYYSHEPLAEHSYLPTWASQINSISCLPNLIRNWRVRQTNIIISFRRWCQWFSSQVQSTKPSFVWCISRNNISWYFVHKSNCEYVFWMNPLSLRDAIVHWRNGSSLNVIMNGLIPVCRQAITWSNTNLLLIIPQGTNLSKISIKILNFSSHEKCSWKWCLHQVRHFIQVPTC